VTNFYFSIPSQTSLLIYEIHVKHVLSHFTVPRLILTPPMTLPLHV